MATWTKNTPNGNTTRRKWNLEDRVSLNNLKYHIASEGCSEVQFDLAKQLLDHNLEQNEELSNQQAIYWLICAAQQGHEPAINLLQKCYNNGCGITNENEDEVRSCLSMTSGERAARKAARELFACLSNGGKHITPKKLEKKMRKIYKMQKRRRRFNNESESSTSEEDDSVKNELQDNKANNFNKQNNIDDNISVDPIANGSINIRALPRYHHNRYKRQTSSTRRDRINSMNLDDQPERITEENLISAAIHYVSGLMPTVNNTLTLSVPHPSSLDHIPCFHRLLFHPRIFLILLYHRFINVISNLPKAVPHNLRLFVLFLLYCLLSMHNLMEIFPVVLYAISWIVMIWSSCCMLKTKHEFIDFRIWSGLFLNYGDHNIESDLSENRFLKNNLQPYMYFFCAFTSNLLIYPVIRADWLPHSELTVLAGIFAFITLITFLDITQESHASLDWIVLISFGVNVLAKYPYEMDDVVTTSWRFLDLKVPNFSSFVIGNGIEFCLNCRTALYLLIPVFLMHLAKRSNWHGIYKYLIPHCVTLSWLQLCINSAQSATMFGMARAALGLAGTLLFLPLFGLVTLLVPVFVTIEWLGFTNPNIRLGSTVVASILTLLLSCFLALHRNTQKYITTLQIVVCLIAASILTFPYMTSTFKDSTRFNTLMSHVKDDDIMMNDDFNGNLVHVMPPLSTEHLNWQKFYMHCGPSAWKNNNRIATQLKCFQLDGMTVAWEGEVIEARISKIKNRLHWYLQQQYYLPQWLINFITCYWGDYIEQPTEECLSDDSNKLCKDFENIIKSGQWQYNKRCTLNKLNQYEYEIRVKMSLGLLSKGSEVVLHASNKFENFTKHLAAGDRIHFYGSLTSNHQTDNNKVESGFIVSTSALAQVSLTAVECILCQDESLKPVILDYIKNSPVDARLKDIKRGITYLLNVLFNPLITFK